MVSVDDLIISLRIDETSNLGRLQKQLTALVGEKGDKQIDLGDLDPGIKRDLALIKDRIVKFTPSVLVGENIKEAALNLAADLRTNKNLTNVMLQRYNINIDKYESFIEELFNISMGISKMNSDQTKGYIAEMTKFRMIADMIKGDRETLVKRLTRMKLEAGFHEKIVDAFREAGIKLLSKPPMFELTKKSVGKGFSDVIKESEIGEDKEKFAALKSIFDKNSDSLKAISEAYEYMKDDVFDITEITQDMIENDKDLRLIIVAQVAAAIEKSNWMVEQFYKAGKGFFTKGKAFAVGGPAYLDTVVHRFSKEAIEQLGIEKVIGDNIDEAMVNTLSEFKTVAGKSEINDELTKRIVKQGYREIYFIVEEYTGEAVNAIVEFLSKEEHKGIKVGLYKLLPRTVQKLLGIAPDLDEMLREAKELREDKEEQELTEEQRKTDMEGLQEFMLGAEEDLGNIRDIGGEVDGLVKKTEKGFLDSAKRQMGIEGKEDEILARLKKKEAEKSKEPPVEKDQTEG